MKTGRNAPCACGSGKKYKHCCQSVRELRPPAPPAELAPLLALFQAGRYAELESRTHLLLERVPNVGLAWKLLSAALQMQGKSPLSALQKAVVFLPDDIDVLINLGNALHDQGDLNGTVENLQQVLALDPNFAEVHNNLGAAWQELGQFDRAVASYRRALALEPNYAEPHSNLGNALKDLGQLDSAVASYQRALEIKPDYLEAHNNLGLVLQDLGKFDKAVASFQRALTLTPDDAEVCSNLGNAFRGLGRIDSAVASYRQALALKPDYAEAHNNLGAALQDIGQLDGAIASYRQALALKPDYVEAHTNLGNALNGAGQLDAALASYRRGLEIKPDSFQANRAYLAALLYNPAITVKELFEEHAAFALRACSSLHKIDGSFSSPRAAHKKLRIGYVSSDFRKHPVGRNIMPLIGFHDRSKLDVYLYGNVQRPDEMTEWFKGAVDGWRSIVGITDQAAAQMIRRDEIDILVLLAGRFDNNRPLIAACRAAPVQVSFHDPATSGLMAMDYLLTDLVLSSRETKERFTERLVRLPTFYVHPPMVNVPDVSTLPAREKGYVTFGSFNNLAKVNEQVVALWSRVLHAVPGSRLILKYQKVFGNESVRQRFLGLFLSQGIEAQRLDLLGASDNYEQHLARYAGIDITLDTFPFTGSTTTFEALWMGMPVVTLLGDPMVARWSGAMLKKLKLEELIANDEAEYVQIAQGLAQNLDRLEALRAGLRERVAQSPLCDEKGRARQIERTYRWMWAKWCAEQAA